MTKSGRKASGIISIIAGAIATFIFIILQIGPAIPESLRQMWLLIILSIIVLVGGILLCVDVMAGGILALCGGGVGIFFSLLTNVSIISYDPSSLWTIGNVMFFGGICLGLAISSGITGIVVGSED